MISVNKFGLIAIADEYNDTIDEHTDTIDEYHTANDESDDRPEVISDEIMGLWI